MFSLSEQSSQFDQLSNHNRELSARLLEFLHPTESDVKLPSGRLFVTEPYKSGLFLLKNGAIFLTDQGNRLFAYEEEELISISTKAYSYPLYYESELAVVVDRFSMGEVARAMSVSPSFQDLWLNYMETQRQLIAIQLAKSLQNESALDPVLEHIEPDLTIMKQGDFETSVYTMIEGGADVFVDGIKVGQIKRDQIFGAFSCLTSSPRSATIITNSRCLLAKIPQEAFFVSVHAL